MKTIVNELVKILQEDIVECYSVVRAHPDSDRHIEGWIRMMLNSYTTTNSKSKAYNELTEIIIKLNRPETFGQAI
jgi:hypothetical protein